MSTAKRLSQALMLAIIGLQFLWFMHLDPPTRLPGWWLAGFLALPLLAVLALHLRGWRAAGFWAGVLALGYFCIGVMEAWTLPSARLPAMLQTLLSAALVLACSWDGMRARFARKPS